MNRREAAAVYGLLAAGWPAWKGSDATVELWMVMLEDLDYDATVTAVRTMVATDDGWPSVAKVREAVARQAGLLAPDADEGWLEVLTAARRQGRYASPSWSHPAIGQAVEVIGWAAICDSSSPDVVRGQWRRAYEAVAERTRAQVCAPGGAIALPSHRHAILQQAPRELGGGHE